jgi:tetratricopeptide (TPR) repeat protein
MLAVDQGALGAARDWYLKALAIKEKFKDLNDAASTYYQLGMLALEQHDYNSAYDWYFKSLSVWEKNDNARGCIAAYIEMGVLTLRKGAVEESVTWLVRAIRRSREAKIRGLTDMAVEHFVYLNTQVSAEDKQMIKAIWHENDLGPFPEGLA